MRILYIALAATLLIPSAVRAQEYLGELSDNPYAPQSTGNPYGQFGSPYAPNSINNPYGPYGSPYSPTSVNNPYTTDAPRIIAQDGTYLGRASANPYDPDSTANPYGPYGRPYSPTSINNPYGQYGSPYSPTSARLPLTRHPIARDLPNGYPVKREQPLLVQPV